jgi:hypothetical protein
MSRAARCTTHYHACDCREEHFREIEAENKKLRAELKAKDIIIDRLNQRLTDIGAQS